MSFVNYQYGMYRKEIRKLLQQRLMLKDKIRYHIRKREKLQEHIRNHISSEQDLETQIAELNKRIEHFLKLAKGV